jgi:hypothetical protein
MPGTGSGMLLVAQAPTPKVIQNTEPPYDGFK